MFALCVWELSDRKIHVYLVKDVISVHAYEVKFLKFLHLCMWRKMAIRVQLGKF